jgi:hypothetical protein
MWLTRFESIIALGTDKSTQAGLIDKSDQIKIGVGQADPQLS